MIEMRKGFGRIIRWVTRNATPERMKWKKIHKLGENQFADGHEKTPGSKNPSFSKSLRNR